MNRRRAATALVCLALCVATNPTGSAAAEVQAAADGCSDDGGALLPDRATPLSALQTDLAWTVTQGAGVTVAVVDSGVDQTNPHLAAAMVTGGVDLVPDPPTRTPPVAPVPDPADPTSTAPPPPPPEPDPGHDGYADTGGYGTVVAGIVAARPLDGSGVVGLAPEASILPVRVYQSDTDRAAEQGIGPDPARTAQGIVYAADHGAQIIVVALSFPDDDPALAAAVDHATARGSLVVASAGDRPAQGKDPVPDGPRYPAAAPGALGVAAVDATGLPVAGSVHGPHVMVAAPAQGVVAPANGGQDCAYAETATRWATAYAAGAAALVAAAHPTETPAQWAYRLTASAVRPDPDRRDDQTGWGAVQPYDALVLVPGTDVRGPANPFTNTTPALETTQADALRTTLTEAPWRDTRRAASTVAVAALVALSVLGPLLVLRARRHEPTTDPLPSTGGLYRDPTAPVR
ncbi:MAG: S8 family serine peptidase [Micrococcales bacterium]|nr:S8 family serine peptidase [Micrococcales bacterium]